jgi:tetratricopeptide (TPR) repeat protein
LADFGQITIQKAGLTVCFFLLSLISTRASDELWQFDSNLQQVHILIMNFQTDQAYDLLMKSPAATNELQKIYLLSLCETVDILITEDEKKFKVIEPNFKERLKHLESLPVSAETLFLQAELNLQLGFSYLNLGQELNATLAIRRAYNFVLDCQKKSPTFIPIKKTSGVIQVMVGSVPDKYRWFMSLLGMKGSVVTGQRQLEQLKSSKSSLSGEATILFYTIKGFISQEFAEASKGLDDYLKKEPENKLLMFLTVNMLVKNSQSEDAYKIIQQMDQHPGGLPIYLIEYLRGEILLERGDYAQAIVAYQKFIRGYRSASFKKDSYYKIGLCYWLQNKPTLARQNFEIAKKEGHNVGEPDQYAARQLEENPFLNPKILKVRYSTDGGYYKEAKETLQNILPADLKTEKDRTEFYYRKARLADKTGDIPAAKIFYQQSITMTGANPWYFAPNSALQLGYLARTQKDYPRARKYFQQALSYKHHEYKNSIDSKAKAALDELPK